MALLEQSLEGGLCRLTLNRPEKRNALNQQLVAELTDAVTRVAADAGVRVVAITGAGPSFSAGADLQQLEALREKSAMENRRDSRRLAELFVTIHTCEKPVIAQVNGDAFGGGAGLIAACDWSIAGEAVQVGFPEVRLGFVPAIVLPFLIRKIGTGTARDLVLRGHRLKSAEAQEIGLIDDIRSPEEVAGAVDTLAREIIRETSGSAVALTKQLLSRIPQMSLEEAVDLSVATNAFARSTEDCQAGVSAFLAGEAPPWKKSVTE